jgi:F0F1-type ATP synthase assembly protein I
MRGEAGGSEHPSGHGRAPAELVPHEFVKIIAVWSLIPSYMLAGGFIGYLVDRWVHWFPYMTGLGLLLALALAVRDMWRLKDEM